MHLFGLTGGIASGKSAVGRRLRERGVPVIDADELAREAVAPGTEGLAEIVRAFGAEFLDASGALDRKRLAALVFAEDSKRRALNAIVHPRIAALSVARAAKLGEEGEPLACYEAALLVENGMADAFRPLVVVSAPEEVQIARAAARDGGTPAEARARVQAQMPLDAKVKLADYVIDNTGTLAELSQKTDAVLERICAGLGIPHSRYSRVQ